MGGGSKQTIGYRYFLGLHMAICHGPVRSVNKIYVGKRLLKRDLLNTNFGPPITTNSTRSFFDIALFGGEKKEGGIAGNVDFEFGAPTQLQNPYLISKLGSDVPAFRGVTCAVFRSSDLSIGNSFRSPTTGGYISAMNPYPKPWAFEVTDIPGGSFNPTKQLINPEDVDGVIIGSANGVHIIYDCLTDSDWGLGYAETDLDITSFTEASNTLFDEGFGLSLIYSQQSTMEEFIQEILNHINAVLYPSRETGNFVIKLIRESEDSASLPVFDESNIGSFESFERPAFSEMVNEIVIKYRKRGDVEDKSITLQDLASVQAQEGIVSQTVHFPGIDSDEIAGRIGLRELRQSSTPLARVRLILNREAWNISPGDRVKLSWVKLGIVEIVLRIVSINYGTLESGLVRIDAVEDIFSLPANTYIAPLDTSWADEVVEPPPAVTERTLELPYYAIQTTFSPGDADAVDVNDAFLQAVSEVSLGTIFNIQLLTRISPNNFVEASDGSITPTVRLTNALNKTDKLTIPFNTPQALNNVVINGYAYLNNEILRIDSVDAVANTIDFGRGYLDSYPTDHTANSVIYFADNNDVRDPITYSNGDSVDAKLLTQTGSGILNEDSAATINLNIVGRQGKPYLPAQIQINSIYFPTSIESEALTITWTHQDRTQQLVIGGQDWYEISLGSPETGVSYTVSYYNNDTTLLLYTDSGLTGLTSTFEPDVASGSTINIRIEVVSIRDSIQSFLTFSHILAYTKPINVRVLENTTDVRVLENTTDRRVLE